jgi:PRC-barrel domain
MLRHAHDLVGVHVGAADGDVGHLHDLYLDDQQWAIRYVVVDTGHWFHHRRVLIAPTDVTHVDWSGRWVDLMLTQGQVARSPAPIRMHRPPTHVKRPSSRSLARTGSASTGSVRSCGAARPPPSC